MGTYIDKASVYSLVLADKQWTLPYLSLGMITANLRTSFDGRLSSHYRIEMPSLGGVDGYPVDHLYAEIEGKPAAVCLFSSYVWNHKLNLEVARELKRRNPSILNIFGGPEVPGYEGETESFLESNRFIDVAVLGEGEVSCAEILLALKEDDSTDLSCLTAVAGIVFRHSALTTRTVARERTRDINHFPSPYLTGEFEPWFEGFSSAILETNRGCPYGCTYCDWGSATLQKVSKFSLDRTIREIHYIAGKKSLAIFLADANFGMLEQDIAIAQALVEVKAKSGYPERLYTNFAKNGGRRLMAVIKILHEGGLLPVGIIALQTTDKDVLAAIRRDNIKTASYEKMMEYFNEQNIPMASDLMIGLPEQTVDSLEKDLQFCFNWKVSANGNYTSLMPNAPMAEKSYIEKYAIKTDSRGLISSTASFTNADLQYMKSLFLSYQFNIRLGVLKYYLYYLQCEHGIAAIEILRKWLDAVLANDEELPISRKMYAALISKKLDQGDWALMAWNAEANFFFQDIEAYYQEFHAFAVRTYDFSLEESILDSLVNAQSATMPKLGRVYPFTVELKHNIVTYFNQYKNAANTEKLNKELEPLSEFEAAALHITPPERELKSLSYNQLDAGHADCWELPSQLRFH